MIECAILPVCFGFWGKSVQKCFPATCGASLCTVVETLPYQFRNILLCLFLINPASSNDSTSDCPAFPLMFQHFQLLDDTRVMQTGAVHVWEMQDLSTDRFPATCTRSAGPEELQLSTDQHPGPIPSTDALRRTAAAAPSVPVSANATAAKH